MSPADPVTLEQLVRAVNNVLKLFTPLVDALKVVPTGSYDGKSCRKLTFALVFLFLFKA